MSLYLKVEELRMWFETTSAYKFGKLWSIVAPDCRVNLLSEFVLNPRALEKRYREEMAFQKNLREGFKK